MAQSLPYRLFGIGKIPTPVISKLQAEGIILWEEGVKGSVTYINFHRPGRISSWRRQGYTASIVLTKARLFALRYSHPIIDIPLADERIRALHCSLEDNAAIFCVDFNAALFHKDWSGTIEYRFHTLQAQTLLAALQKELVFR